MSIDSYEYTPDPSDRCDCQVIHPEAVDFARTRLSPPESLASLAEFFRLFGDPSRLRIVQALRAAELCVCDLAALLGMSQSAVSHQLKSLRLARVVRVRREGKVAFYSLDDDHVASIFDQGEEHLGEGRGP